MAERQRAPPTQQQHAMQQQLPTYALPPYQPYGRAPLSAAELPLSLASLMLLLRDAEYLTARYGSTAAACARLEELEHAHAEMQAQLAALQQKLTQVAPRQNASGFDVDALLGFVQRHVACRGSLALLQPVLFDFQRSLALPPDARFAARDVLLSVQELASDAQQQQHAIDVPSPMPLDSTRKKRHPDLTRLTPKDKAPSASPVRSNGAAGTPRLIAPASNGDRAAKPTASSGSSVDKRARHEENQTVSAAAMLSAMARSPGDTMGSSAATSSPLRAAPASSHKTNERGVAKATAAAASAARRGHTTAPVPSTSTTATTVPAVNSTAAQPKKRTPPRPQEEERAASTTASSPEKSAGADAGDGAVGTRKRSTASLAAAASHEVVVKQNLSLPHDKRNIVELKQSSQHLTLENLDELNKRAPWDDVYKLRATFSHVLDYAALDEPARKWFLGALRVQFVWRREFWERLHWLPMSETVCSGPGWERYRQTRKRRANKAIAAWRKVYSDSLELMRQRLLPEDVWCDVALWYMPSTPLYWLPNSPDLVAELALVDAKHPVRCYFVQDFRKHPFYNDDDIQRKYPRQFELPTPQMLALHSEDKESRVNITPE